MKVRIVFEPYNVGPQEDWEKPENQKLRFVGFFGEDGEPEAEAEMQGEGWIADGDVEAFDVEVYSV